MEKSKREYIENSTHIHRNSDKIAYNELSTQTSVFVDNSVDNSAFSGDFVNKQGFKERFGDISMVIKILSKKSIIIAVLCCVIPVFCIFAFAMSKEVAKTAGSDNFYYGTIVVDAGHGGIDGGVVGSLGIKESDINLRLAKILEKKLSENNFKVVMTRTTENSLSNIKRIDMQMRKDIIVKASPIAVISLHVNKFSDSSRRGVQVFYDDLKVGKDFGDFLQSYLNENINAKYSKRSDYNAIAGDLFITKCVKVPSVIVECGFISNKEDERLLMQDSFCQDLCDRICQAVCILNNPE